MTRYPHTPLDPTERELARRLARLDSNAAPSAALDAAILAAARADTDRSGAPPSSRAHQRPRPRRWTVGTGIAASLALAVGVAWQLRPLPQAGLLETPSETAPHPAAAPATAPTRSAGGASASAALPEQAPIGSARGTPEAATVPAAARGDAAPAPTAGSAPRSVPDRPASTMPGQQAQEPRSSPPNVPDLPLRARAASAPASTTTTADPQTVPPPSAPAPASPGQDPAAATPSLALPAERHEAIPAPSPAAAAARTGEAPGSSSLRGSPAPAIPAPPAGPSLERHASDGRTEPTAIDALAHQPFDDEPPASADSPTVRAAWLQRIRELRDEGQPDHARASLREFVRRHPQAAVPDDLRPLLEP